MKHLQSHDLKDLASLMNMLSPGILIAVGTLPHGSGRGVPPRAGYHPSGALAPSPAHPHGG